MDWLADLIERHGPWQVLVAPLTLLSLAAGLGSLAGSDTALPLALGILLFAAIVLIAALGLVIRRLRQEAGMRQWALSNLRRYTKSLKQVSAETRLWRDELHVGKKGTVAWRAILTTDVLHNSASPLHFIEWTQGGEALTKRDQRRVVFSVLQMPGKARLPVEVEWRSPTEVYLVIHFPNPIPPGKSVTLEIEFTWPRTLPLLSQGGVEHLEWGAVRFTHRLEYVVVLDASYRRTRALGVNPSGMNPPQQTQEGNTWRIEGSAVNLQQGQTVSLALDSR